MFEHTDTAFSPWNVVESDSKKKARINCIRHFISLIKYVEIQQEDVILPDRVQQKNYKRPRLLSIWRNSLLFLFGIFHALLWDGDILRIYGISAILIIFL